MGQLLALTQKDEMTQAKKHSPKQHKRSFTCFKHRGHDVCMTTFCFLHTIGKVKFQSSFESNGLCPRKRPYVKPHHALRLADIEYVVSFIRNYAEDHAILLPGRIPGYKQDDVVLLPSSTTKITVWNLYHAAAENAPDVKAVGYSSFCSLWKQLLPQILVCKPMSDLCWTCQQNSTKIMRAHNRPEEKSEVCMIFNSILYTCTLFNGHSLIPPVSLSISLSHTLSHTPLPLSHTHTHTHTHTLSLFSLPLSLPPTSLNRSCRRLRSTYC